MAPVGTKYPAPHTIKFATFARKPTVQNLAVGGLAAELTVYQLVQAVIPPQFGNFSVMERQAIASEISKEISAVFLSFQCPPLKQVFVHRELSTLLNDRRPPTVTVASQLRRADRHFFGKNRPEQTGEEADVRLRRVRTTLGTHFGGSVSDVRLWSHTLLNNAQVSLSRYCLVGAFGLSFESEPRRRRT